MTSQTNLEIRKNHRNFRTLACRSTCLGIRIVFVRPLTDYAARRVSITLLTTPPTTQAIPQKWSTHVWSLWTFWTLVAFWSIAFHTVVVALLTLVRVIVRSSLAQSWALVVLEVRFGTRFKAWCTWSRRTWACFAWKTTSCTSSTEHHVSIGARSTRCIVQGSSTSIARVIATQALI